VKGLESPYKKLAPKEVLEGVSLFGASERGEQGSLLKDAFEGA
jgi:hypothetical protein